MERCRDRHVEDLQEFVRIPSVSADPAYDGDMARAAQWLIERLDRAGLERVRLVPTDGHPAVVAQWLGAGADKPTLLIYGHYDVQPARKEDGWGHEPFGGELEPAGAWHGDGARVLGRGASDMKGQILCHIQAVAAWLEATGGLPINVKFLIEGEEEVGSPHFQQIIDRECKDLDAHLILISDAPMRDPQTPTIGYSTRGLVYFEVHVHGPKHDLHSGVFGGVVRNPLDALVEMLASLKDVATGEILPEGFHDGIRKASEGEIERLAREGEPAQRILEAAGVEELWCPAGDIQACLGLRPTLEVHGIWGGYTGPGSKTVIPASAHAKLSARIVADQDPDQVAEAVVKHLRDRAPRGVQAHIDILHKVYPVHEDADARILRPIQKALEDTWGTAAVRLPVGGSIGAMAMMDRSLKARPYLVAFGNWDEGMHGPDEFFRVDMLHKGGDAVARMLWELAQDTGDG